VCAYNRTIVRVTAREKRVPKAGDTRPVITVDGTGECGKCLRDEKNDKFRKRSKKEDRDGLETCTDSAGTEPFSRGPDVDTLPGGGVGLQDNWS